MLDIVCRVFQMNKSVTYENNVMLVWIFNKNTNAEEESVDRTTIRRFIQPHSIEEIRNWAKNVSKQSESMP